MGALFTDQMIHLLPPESVKPTLFLVLCSTWIILGLFAYLNFYTRRHYFTLWTTGWLFYALWIAITILFFNKPPLPGWEWIKFSCIGICAVYLLWGTLQFSGHPQSTKTMTLWVVALVLWNFFTEKLLGHSLWSSLPLFLILSASSFFAAYYFFQRRINDQYVGASMLSVGFTLWSLVMLSYPFLETSQQISPTIFLISSGIQLIIAVGMIVLMLEEVRGETKLLQDQIKADARVTHDLQKELRIFKKKYDGLLKNATDSIYTVDPESLQILEVNQAAEQLTGYTRDELLQLRFVNICPLLREYEYKIAENPELLPKLFVEHGNIPIQRKDHNITITQGSALVSNYARRTTLQIFLRELTYHFRLEQQLRQAQRVSAIGQLISGMAHELNNPLAVISGYAQLITMRKTVDEKTKSDLSKIQKESERASKTVQNFLTFARKHSTEKTNVNLNQLLPSTLNLMQYDIRSSGVQLIKEFEPDLPDVFAEASQLEQVFLNLIKNGIESMQGMAHEKVLKIRTWSQAGNVKVEVIDRGNGIPAQMLEKIFDLSAQPQETGSGLGFGLSISYHIIKDHSGGLSARNHPDGGTVFIVELPVSNQQSTKKESSPNSPSPSTKPTKQSFDVLVVDDEVAIQDVFSELLADHACRVHGANNGLEAIRLIEKQEFDLIISDLKMPVMDGRWLYEKIKETKPAALKKFIFITGDTNSAKTADFLEHCGNPWLTKPFNFQDVENVLMDYIHRIQQEALSTNNQ